MPDVVITGASGFIGKALCAELLERGVTVYGVSRGQISGIPGIRHCRVESYERFDSPPGAFCIHLAGGNNAKDFTADLQAGKNSAIAVAGTLATRDFARVIYASSGLVYGDHAAEPRRECDPVNPLGSYAAVKAAVEEIFLAHGHGVARLANVYGPGMSPVNLFADILKQIPGRGPLYVRDVAPVRDYVHVRDVARGLAELALGQAAGIFNLGTGVGTSAGQLAAYLARSAGEENRTVVSRAAGHHPSTLILDPGKIRQSFGWKAAVNLSDGIRELVEQRLSRLSRVPLNPGE